MAFRNKNNPFKKPDYLMYGEPQPCRVNPSSPPNKKPCPLCSYVFDAPAQLRLNLQKDGYGECFFCPKCGQKLKEYVEEEILNG